MCITVQWNVRDKTCKICSTCVFMQIVLGYEYDFSFMSIKYKYHVQIKMPQLIPFLMPRMIIMVTLLSQLECLSF